MKYCGKSFFPLAIAILVVFLGHLPETLAKNESTLKSSKPLKSFLKRKLRSISERNTIDRTRSLTESLSISKNQLVQQNRLPQSNSIVATKQQAPKSTFVDEDIQIHIGRQLQIRNRRKRSIFKSGIENGKGSDHGKGKGKDSKMGKGKGSKGGKGKSKGSSKGSKGKGGDDGKGKGGKGKGGNDICEKLDFRDYYYGKIFGKGAKGGKGMNSKGDKGKKRQLQFGGENCSPNVLETARQNPDLSIFVEAIEVAGLEEIFECAGPFTVLAPTNAAFEENPSLLNFLLTHPNKLQEVLLYHIVPGFFLTQNLEPGPLETLLGEDVLVRLDPIRFNQAGVVEADILACNGVIDTIDDVLIPPGGILPEVCSLLDFRQPGQFPVPGDQSSTLNTLELLNSFDRRRLQYEGELCNPNMYSVALDNPDTQNFAALLDVAGLSEIFLCAGPFTVLAPSNDAIDAIDPDLLKELLLPANRERLQELLLYHIVPGYLPTSDLTEGPVDTLLFGEQVQVSVTPTKFNQAGVVEPDIMGCNGVMYVLDDILVPDNDFCSIYDFDTRRRLQDGGEDCSLNVLDTAREDPDLTNIVALINAAGLAPIFDCAGPFTALLPTNEALEAVDPALLEDLLLPENLPELQDLILYHILPGATLSVDFEAGPYETLLEGETVDVSVNPLMFNDANVLEADIEACNGYIDKLDMVLLPFPQPDTPTIAPTPPVSDICSEFTFNRRRLQVSGGQDCSPNMLETARDMPELSTIVSLFEAAGLEEVFSCPGPFTGFFPTNDAFDSVDPQIVDFLTDPANVNALRGLLLYHLVGGENTVSDLAAGAPKDIDTLLPDETIQIGPVTGGPAPVTVNGNEIVDPDVEACNGIIQVIDGVLIPGPVETGSPTTAPTSAPIVPGAPTAAPVVATSSPSVAPVSVTTSSPTVSPTSAPVTPGSPTTAPVVATSAPSGAPAVGASEAPSGAPVPGATGAPSIAPSITSTTRRIQRYAISYNTANDITEPTQAQDDLVFNNTANYFSESFTAYEWEGNTNVEFVSMTTTPGLVVFNNTARWRIVMNYNFSDFTFAQGSEIPSISQIFEAMRSFIRGSTYVQDNVWVAGDPFSLVNIAKIDMQDVEAPTPTP